MDELAIKIMLATRQQTPVSRLLALALDGNELVRVAVLCNGRLPSGVAERLLHDECESVRELARIAIAIRANKASVSRLEGKLRDEIFYSLWGDEMAQEAEEEAEEEDEEESFRFKEDKPSSSYEW